MRHLGVISEDSTVPCTACPVNGGAVAVLLRAWPCWGWETEAGGLTQVTGQTASLRELLPHPWRR